jgi:hypothetical protein
MSTATIADQSLVGKRVRATNIPGVYENDGLMGYDAVESYEVVVTGINYDNLPTATFRYKYNNSNEDWNETQWYFDQWVVLEDTEPADPKDQQIKDLTAQLESYRETQRQQTQRIIELEGKPQDVTTAIGDHLIEVATNHGYCSTYDDEVENLNGILARRYGVQLPLRRNLVSRRFRVIGRVATYVDVMVDGSMDDSDQRDPDNWMDEDGDGLDSDFVTDRLDNEIQNGGWDSTEVEVY